MDIQDPRRVRLLAIFIALTLSLLLPDALAGGTRELVVERCGLLC